MPFCLWTLFIFIFCCGLICIKKEVVIDGRKSHINWNLIKMLKARRAKVQLCVDCKFRNGFELIIKLFHDFNNLTLWCHKIWLANGLLTIIKQQSIPLIAFGFKLIWVFHFNNGSEIAFNVLNLFFNLVWTNYYFRLFFKEGCYLSRNLLFKQFLKAFFCQCQLS